MVTGYIFVTFLIILGLLLMRFASIHLKKFKEKKTKIKTYLNGHFFFLVFFLIIIGLIIYSIKGLFIK